jgi:uncharacterized protein YegP (UPF0339 family)
MTAFRIGCAAVLAVGFLGLSSASAGQKEKDESRMKFEWYKDKAGEFRWRLKAGNGLIMATAGESYKRLEDAKNSIDLLQKAATDDKAKFEVYEDKAGEFRWRLKAGNNQIVAVASEGYKEKSGAERALATIKAGAAKAEVVEVKE